jgi:hypothetical protein
MFMRHWLSAALFKRKSPLFRLLPEDFKFGRPLPFTPLARQLQQSAPKGTRRRIRRKPAPSRRHGHFAHGCELLAV